MYVDIVEQPELKAAVMRIPRDGAKVREAWSVVSRLMKDHPALRDRDNGYVFIPEWQWATEVTTLWVGVAVNSFEGLPESLEAITIPAKRYARIKVKGNRSQMDRTYGFLKEWFDHSPFERDVREGSIGFEVNPLFPVNSFEIAADEINEFDFDIYAPMADHTIGKEHPYSGVIGVEVREADPRTVVGFEQFIDRKKVSAEDAVAQLWQLAFPLLKQLNHAKAPLSTYGLFGYEPPFGPGQDFRYLAGIEVEPDSNGKLQEGMTERVIPAGEYAAVTYRGTAADMEQIWSYFHNVWFPLQTDYEVIDQYEFERFDERFLGSDHKLSIYELHFPIRRRAQDTRLTDATVFDEKGNHVLQDMRSKEINMASFQHSKFLGIDMRNAALRHVNFVHSNWEHVYFAGVHIRSIQMGGTVFEDIRRPDSPVSRLDGEPGTDGWINVEPVIFRDSDLSTARFENCDLSEADITGCRLDGMKIDGIPVTELLDFYLKRKEA